MTDAVASKWSTSWCLLDDDLFVATRIRQRDNMGVARRHARVNAGGGAIADTCVEPFVALYQGIPRRLRPRRYAPRLERL